MHTQIEQTPSLPTAEVILYGSCGQENSWREPFKVACVDTNKTYFDPFQVTGWSRDSLPAETGVLYNSKTVVVGVHAGTLGYGSLAEIGWSISSSLLTRKSLSFYVERVSEASRYSQEFLRTRQLVVSQSERLNEIQPGLCHISQTYDEFVDHAVSSIYSAGHGLDIPLEAARPVSKIPEIAIFGTTQPCPDSTPRTIDETSNTLQSKGLPTYIAYKPDWDFDKHHTEEIAHKIGARVLLQCIDAHHPSYGSLVETGMLTAASVMSGRPFGVLIEDYTDPETGIVNPEDYPNRLRALQRHHLEIVSARTSGLVRVARDKEELVDFGYEAYKDNA